MKGTSKIQHFVIEQYQYLFHQFEEKGGNNIEIALDKNGNESFPDVKRGENSPQIKCFLKEKEQGGS